MDMSTPKTIKKDPNAYKKLMELAEIMNKTYQGKNMTEDFLKFRNR
jgi:hypothetical protein